jgi:hypothetical protein
MVSAILCATDGRGAEDFAFPLPPGLEAMTGLDFFPPAEAVAVGGARFAIMESEWEVECCLE